MPAVPGFIPSVVVLDEGRWSFRENTKGNRLKTYCTPAGPVDTVLDGVGGWFWKESDRKYPHEFWSEILACQLGAVMDVPVPRTHLGIFQGKPGSLAETILGPGEELVEAADIMAELDDSYERRGKGKQQTVELAKSAIRSFLWYDCAPAMEAFHRMLVFDAWIGNQDRHHENWGFVQAPDGSRRFSDIFDNGSSLLRELPNEATLQSRVGTPALVKSYAARASSEIRWTPGKKTPHLELFQHCIQDEPGFRDSARRILAADPMWVRSAVERVAVFSRQSGIMPEIEPMREGILLDVLAERRARLIERLS